MGKSNVISMTEYRIKKEESLLENIKQDLREKVVPHIELIDTDLSLEELVGMWKHNSEDEKGE